MIAGFILCLNTSLKVSDTICYEAISAVWGQNHVEYGAKGHDLVVGC